MHSDDIINCTFMEQIQPEVYGKFLTLSVDETIQTEKLQ